MNIPSNCIENTENTKKEDTLKCFICNKELDYITASASNRISDSIYICQESINQKIFVYGKYIGGKYSALHITKYYSKEECNNKICEDEIKQTLNVSNDEEYSRLITCKKGNMDLIILTKNMINVRKNDLINNKLGIFFQNPQDDKKYYCYEHARNFNFKCNCSHDLIQLGSERHRELSGMEDQKFINKFFPEILELK